MGSMAVVEFIAQYINEMDIVEFDAATGVPPQAPPTLLTDNGVNDASNPGIEAELDIEYLLGVAQGVPAFGYIINSPYGPFASAGPAGGIPSGTGGWILEYGGE